MIPGSSKLRWLWKAPARALGRARDYYVRSMTGCARYVPADEAFGAYPVMVPMAPLPRSHSYGAGAGSDSGEEDFRELVRASSERRDGQQRQAAKAAVARSQSTATGRSMAPIDEDGPSEFGGGGGGVGVLYPRSQSYASGAVAGRPPRFPRKETAVLA